LTWAAALFVVAAFVVVAGLLRIPTRAREVLAHSRQAFADLRDPALDERAREKAVQGHALRLLWLFLVVTGSAAFALALPFGLIVLLDSAGLVAIDAVIALTLSWPFLLGTCLGGAAVWALFQSRPA
jgi:hypothetical protein